VLKEILELSQDSDVQRILGSYRSDREEVKRRAEGYKDLLESLKEN